MVVAHIYIFHVPYRYRGGDIMPRGRPFKCPYDGSTNTVSKGVRKTKTMGVRKLRLCKKCGRKFTPKNQKLVEE